MTEHDHLSTDPGYRIVGVSHFGAHLIDHIKARYSGVLSVNANFESACEDHVSYLKIVTHNDVDPASAFLLDKKAPVIIILPQSTPALVLEGLQMLFREHRFVVVISDGALDSQTGTSRITVENEEGAFQAAHLILDIARVPTWIGVNFEDLEKVLKQGDLRFTRLDKFQEVDLSGACRVLFGVYGNEDFGASELMQIVEKLLPKSNPDALFLFTVFSLKNIQKDSPYVLVLKQDDSCSGSPLVI